MFVTNSDILKIKYDGRPPFLKINRHQFGHGSSNLHEILHTEVEISANLNFWQKLWKYEMKEADETAAILKIKHRCIEPGNRNYKTANIFLLV